MTDGFIILDRHGAIEWFNPVAERHFSLDPEIDLGHGHYLFRSPAGICALCRVAKL